MKRRHFYGTNPEVDAQLSVLAVGEKYNLTNAQLEAARNPNPTLSGFAPHTARLIHEEIAAATYGLTLARQ